MFLNWQNRDMKNSLTWREKRHAIMYGLYKKNQLIAFLIFSLGLGEPLFVGMDLTVGE